MTDAVPDLRASMQAAYDAAGRTWGTGPERVYSRLAEALIGRAGMTLTGALALDAGAGTGVVSRVLRAHGARPVAVDLSTEMLRASGLTAVLVGDVVRLPLRAGVVDVAAAAFVLNHLPDATAALAELGRVTRPGGVVLASAFAEGPEHPAKAAVDEVAAGFGFRRPAWYAALKHDLEPRTADPGRLAAMAAAAGLAEVTVDRVVVDLGDLTPADLAAYRLGMAHLAAFVMELPPAERERLAAAAAEAVAGMPPLRSPILALRAGPLHPRS